MQRLLLLALLFILIGAACTKAAVLEPRDANALPISDDGVMREVILDALRERGWRVEDEMVGAIAATVRAGGHEATVEVRYDGRGYLIRHLRSSPGLAYRGDTVHKRYNRWVAALDRSIQKRVRSLTY
jgi:hypothetical protein